MNYQMVLMAVAAMTFIRGGFADSQAPIKLDTSVGVTLVDGVFINGTGPYRFILDTGSETNHLDPRLARTLRIETTLDFVLNTPSGQSNVRGGSVDTVTLGAMQATRQEFLLTDFAGVRQHCPGVVGMLGQEFLRNFDYVLDLQHHRLVPADPPSSGMRVPMLMIEGRMAVSTNFGDLILDSGADSLLLFRSSLRSDGGSITTAEGSLISVSTEVGHVLRIGNRLYRIERTNFAPMSGAQEAGLLPTTVFQAIYVSNSGHYLILDPRISK